MLEQDPWLVRRASIQIAPELANPPNPCSQLGRVPAASARAVATLLKDFGAAQPRKMMGIIGTYRFARWRMKLLPLVKPNSDTNPR